MAKAKITDVREIPLSSLEIGLGQVRLRETGKEIDELAESIRQMGQLEPIVVCNSPREGMFQILTGQRRFLAMQQLGHDTIWAAIVDRELDETEAKVISLTENLVRRDLNTLDLIDACTALFRKYGSIKLVADETGLPYNKVAQYVKYDQLVPELKELVDKGEVSLNAALRGQKAASVSGKVSTPEAITFAKELTPMSGAQQTQVVKEREENPAKPAEDVIESAKAGGKVTQIIVTLSADVHRQLKQYADGEHTNMDDAARALIEEALAVKGNQEA
jgi:ParB family chromosome partitioning protein